MDKKIKITKTDNQDDSASEKEDSTEIRKKEMAKLFSNFETPSNKFNEEVAFQKIVDYSKKYDRILYSTISTIIYKNNSEEGNQINGDVLSNLETLISYVENNSEIPNKPDMIQAKRTVWKIWDHVNLANQQFTTLGETDTDFKKRFQKSIKESTNSLMKDMNGQLLSMVGIFTALAFLLFGGISSLESIFRNAARMPILALSIISTMWVLGLLNVIFVFLYCVGRMTKLNFKATDKQNANFWQRYPVVCWVDLGTTVLLCFLGWTYVLYNHKALTVWYRSIKLYPLGWGIVGYVLIAILAAVFIYIMEKQSRKIKK